MFNFSNTNPDGAFYRKAWDEVSKLSLGAELIVATFTDSDPAIFYVPSDATEPLWVDNYAVIGSGGLIASAILRQREYDGQMDLTECLYRVLEAKLAAENTPYVGQATRVEVMTLSETFEVDQKYQDKIFAAIVRHRAKVPKITLDPKFLTPMDDDEQKEIV